MKKKNQITCWLFIIPSVLGVAVFYIIPFFISFYYSFTDNILSKNFVGILHYVETFENPAFKNSLKNTIILVSICITLNTILSFFLAYLIRNYIYLKSMMYIFVILPFFIPSGSTIYFWRVIFDNNGLLNKIIINNYNQSINWDTNPFIVLVVVFIFLWKNIGYCTILFAARMNWISEEYYDVLKLEGGKFRHELYYVVGPFIMPTISTVALMSFTFTSKIFKEIYLLFKNYPNKNIYLLQHYINNQIANLNFQKMSAASISLCFLSFILILFISRFRYRGEDF
ncbi:MAG: sugar ABC transporter permease [Oscillospiraceae bacterium]|jgi:multiple sugar transport system permease protein|nr:sugar ABC transporter permease [Oscillospiraceae bacterium]